MKATGIIRKIDDLGRVVIPKEIRRTMRIREGDPLEIYTNRDGEVIFKKYSLLEGLEDFAADLCETLNHALSCTCAVADRDVLLAVSGSGKRELLEHQISSELSHLQESRRFYCAGSSGGIPAASGNEKHRILAAAPVLTEGDGVGSILLLGSNEADPPDDVTCRLLQVFASFLGKHLES